MEILSRSLETTRKPSEVVRSQFPKNLAPRTALLISLILAGIGVGCDKIPHSNQLGNSVSGAEPKLRECAPNCPKQFIYRGKKDGKISVEIQESNGHGAVIFTSDKLASERSIKEEWTSQGYEEVTSFTSSAGL